MATAALLADLAAPTPAPASDRRGSARSRLFTLVQTGDGLGPMWAWDIGLGGLLVKAKRPRWPGTYLDVTLTLPGTGETLKLGAQVLTLDQDADGVGMSLRFCRSSAAARLAIYRFLDRRRALWDPEAETSPQEQLRARYPALAKELASDEPFRIWLDETNVALVPQKRSLFSWLR